MNALNYSIYIFSTPKPGPSFQSPVWLAPVPVNFYTQGSPIYMPNDQHFTIPQVSYAFKLLNITFLIAYGPRTVTNSWIISLPQKVLGQCVNSAPVAFLENFNIKCVTLLRSCPSGSPLQTQASDLRIKVNDGQGGMFHLLNMARQCFKASF